MSIPIDNTDKMSDIVYISFPPIKVCISSTTNPILYSSISERTYVTGSSSFVYKSNSFLFSLNSSAVTYLVNSLSFLPVSL